MSPTDTETVKPHEPAVMDRQARGSPAATLAALPGTTWGPRERAWSWPAAER